MKILSLNKSMIILGIAAIILAACTKESAGVRLDPKLATTKVSDITDSSALVSGYAIARGDGFTEQGVCMSTTGIPTTADQKIVVQKLENAIFKAQFSGLNYTSRYYVRAYATDAKGNTLYGDTLSFVTKIRLAKISLVNISDNTGKTATSGGNVTDLGGGTVTAKGVCWRTKTGPTIKNDTTLNGKGLGSFVSHLKGLYGDSTYYIRAYAINEAGTAYSNEISFAASKCAPYVTTKTAVGLETTATVDGQVTYDGGATITERGICYGTTANPTTASNIKTSAGTVGTFEVSLTGLTSSTTYHYRAYATNSYGTSYGEDKTFATYPSALYMIGDGVIDDPAHQWDWTVDLPMIPVNSHANLFWKIVWLRSSGGFKINSAKAWNGSEFGKTGSISGDIWNKGGDNIDVPGTAGYYMVVVDFETNKIQVTSPKVYGMGDAFGGWTGGIVANLFTVDNTNGVIKFNGVPNAGNLRMYVSASTLACDWWQAEFNIIGGNLAFRGTGGDQTAVPVTAGQNVSLNFKAGTGSITP